MLVSAESQVPKLISREIIFAEFQRVWSQSTNVTDGRTDGQTPYHGNTALYASRGKNGKVSRMLWRLRVHLTQLVGRLLPLQKLFFFYRNCFFSECMRSKCALSGISKIMWWAPGTAQLNFLAFLDLGRSWKAQRWLRHAECEGDSPISPSCAWY